MQNMISGRARDHAADWRTNSNCAPVWVRAAVGNTYPVRAVGAHHLDAGSAEGKHDLRAVWRPAGEVFLRLSGRFPSSLWSGVRLKPGRSRRHPLRTRRVCTRRRAVAGLIARKGYLGTAGRPISREVVRQVVCELGPSRAAGVYRVNLRVAIPAIREDYLAIILGSARSVASSGRREIDLKILV